MRMGRKFLCGVPKKYCCGSFTTVDKHSIKTHGTPQESFNCHKRYLLATGYKQIGSREFLKPGEPIRVLTKKCRFGSPIRVGKNESNQITKKTFMRTGGVIISV
jgi:hypothetical protein